MGHDAPSRFSVVIPVHDGAAVLGRCLQSFVPGLAPGEAEVVVVAYACTDRSAEVARGHAGVRVVELAHGSRASALNAGDAAVSAFPRVYVRPGAVVSIEGLRLLVEALDVPDVRAAVPVERVVAASRPRAVHHYFAVREELGRATEPQVRYHTVYGLSRRGRARFGAFPDDEADHLFVERLLRAEEQGTVRVAAFESDAPSGLRELIAARAQRLRGRLDQQQDGDEVRLRGHRAAAHLLRLVREDPSRSGRVAVFAAVELLALLSATRRPVLAGDVSGGQSRRQQRAVVDGVAFDRLGEQEVHARVLGDLARGRGGLVVTANVDILRQLRQPQHRSLTDAAQLVVADGAPIVWASRLLGDRLPERVTGSSLIWSLSGAAAAAGHRVMLLGGAEGVAQRAAERLEDQHPDLLRVQWHFPPFGFDVDEVGYGTVIDAVKRAEPDIVFLGLGFPRQERLALRLLEHFPTTWFIGCGGSITMLAGDVARAPSWMQRCGLEWAHRLAKEPRRLARRYLIDDLPYAVGLLARAGLRGDRGDRGDHSRQ